MSHRPYYEDLGKGYGARMLRAETTIEDEQLGFMSGKGTTEVTDGKHREKPNGQLSISRRRMRVRHEGEACRNTRSLFMMFSKIQETRLKTVNIQDTSGNRVKSMIGFP